MQRNLAAAGVAIAIVAAIIVLAFWTQIQYTNQAAAAQDDIVQDDVLDEESVEELLPTETPEVIANEFDAATTPTLEPIFTPNPLVFDRLAATPTAAAGAPLVSQLGMGGLVGAAPLPPPSDLVVNGLSLEEIVVLDDDVLANMREVYLSGAQKGRVPYRLSKLGDSTIMQPMFLGRFDGGDYNLGDFAYLQPAVAYFAGSFDRVGVATRVGLHAWSVFDPMWSDKTLCQPNEDLLACEFRLHNPGLIIIRLGSNDAGIPETFEDNLRQIIEFSLAEGVIPILGTKADRFEGLSNINNETIRRLAQEYEVPLWEYDIVAGTLPDRGLGEDGVHVTEYLQPSDYRQSLTLQSGQAMQDLTALMVVESVWRQAMQDE